MNLWGKGRRVLLFFFLALFACDDETYLLGFKSPDENFKVVYAEFKLPTTVYQIDSLITSNSSSSATNRLLVGSFSDSNFGNGTATAYMQYFPTSFPTISDTAKFERITMTLVYDLYHFGSTEETPQRYEFYELADSIVNSIPYYTKSSTPHESVSVGTAFDAINPAEFDDLVTQNNSDRTTDNDIFDSLNVDLSDVFGQKVFEAMRATDSVSLAKYRNFSRWRRIFKGLAMVPTATDKVVGITPVHKYSRIIIWYREGTTSKQLQLSVSPANFVASYSNITIDRTGTPVSLITEPFTSYEPADGLRYLHSGAGIVTRVDLDPVYKYFENIPVKALNVAELSIVGDQQETAPTGFVMRAVKPNNRVLFGTTQGVNEAYDPVTYADPKFAAKHFINSKTPPRADVLADDGELFVLEQKSNEGAATYKGYLTTFLQLEVNLADKDYLRYFALIPTSPEFGKSMNGFYFHQDSLKLKIFYTTPIIEE